MKGGPIFPGRIHRALLYLARYVQIEIQSNNKLSVVFNGFKATCPLRKVPGLYCEVVGAGR